jgi:hypothetical protein
MQHWMIAFCCSVVGSIASFTSVASVFVLLVVPLAVLVLEEDVLVVAEVLLVMAEPDEVVAGDAGSAAMTSANMSSKASSAVLAAFASAACRLPFLFFGILSREVEL